MSIAEKLEKLAAVALAGSRENYYLKLRLTIISSLKKYKSIEPFTVTKHRTQKLSTKNS